MRRFFTLKRKPDARDWINITVIIMLLCLFVWVSLNYSKWFGTFDVNDLTGSTEKMQQFILSFGQVGLLLLVLMHLVQVVISIIPSVLVQFVGALIFGTFAGMVTGIVGIALGTAISFYLSRFLGRRILTLFVSDKNIERLEGMVSGNMSTLALLVLFMLPTPKDFFAYFVGLTNMKASRFFIISAVGRLPGMLIASYIGAHVFEFQPWVIITIAVVGSLLFLGLIIFKNKLFEVLAKYTQH